MGFRAKTVAAVAIMVLATASLTFAAPRVVLFEDATSTTCPPCGPTNPIIHQIATNYGSQVAMVAWHCWWPAPGNDPFYLHNPSPQQTRISYYGINSIPDCVIDGLTHVYPSPYSAMANVINNRLAIPSPLAFQNMSGLLQGSNMNLSFDLNVETPQAGTNFRLFVIATEEDIPYNWQGQTHCYDVFRQTNGNTGEVIDLSVGGVQHFNRTLPFNAAYNPLGMHAVVFVQNYTTKEIIQAGEFPIAVPYHFSVSYVGAPVQIGASNQVVSYGGTVLNDGGNPDTYNVSVSGVPAGWAYSYTTPAGTFSGPSTLPLNSQESAAINLDLDSQGNSGSATVEMTFSSQADPLQVLTLEFRKINGLTVLLVDDDNGETRESRYGPSLDAAGVVWDRWDMAAWGTLTSQDLLNAADAVVWFCGAGTIVPSFTADEQQAITDFLAAGGDLFVNGSDIGYMLADAGSPYYTAQSAAWYASTFRATYQTNFVFGSTISGIAGDPISDGLVNLTLDNTVYTPGLLDGVQAAAGANEVWTFNNQTYKAGTRYANGNSQVVYFSFPFECLPQASQRDLVMQRIIDYFELSTAGVEDPLAAAPVRSSLGQNVPNPFNPVTVIDYALAQAGDVSLRVYDLNGRMVRELVNGPQSATRYQVEWDGRDDAGRSLASGVYFYQLKGPGIQETRRMVLAK